MSKDLHIFTNGKDPFVFKLKKIVVHVHAGAPPAAGSTPSPMLDPADYTNVPPVLGVRVVSPGDQYVLDQIQGSWSSEDRVKLIVQDDWANHPSLSQLDSVLDGLSNAESDDVTVYILQMDEQG